MNDDDLLGTTDTDEGTATCGSRSMDVGAAAVVVPIYAGHAETLVCLASLARTGGGRDYEVIVIDDASPDAELSAAVAAFAAEAGFVYRRNATNMGFPATANRAFRLRPDHDIVLLNADTEVPNGWLARLCAVAATDLRIATVTPLSNNATIMSVPDIGGASRLPYGLPLEEIDALCERLDDGSIPDVPTAHGFCMFIRRAALRELGGFDAALFGRGYGEENDFSLRARAKGWRNVVAANLFVRHAGAVSFDRLNDGDGEGVRGDDASGRAALLARNLTSLNARHPGYHAEIAAFIATDPLRAIRRRIPLHLWRGRGAPVVMVTHAMPGGTGRHVLALSHRLVAQGRFVLWLQALSPGEATDGRDATMLLRTPPGALVANGRGEPANDDAVLRYVGPGGIVELLSDLAGLAPAFVHVHHLIDLPPAVVSFLRRSGTPYVVTVHDYFFGCPRVTLLDEGGTFCGAPVAPLCAPCLASGVPHPALHPGWRDAARDGVQWRAGWAGFLAGARQVMVPSQAAAQMMTRLFPALRIDVRPHAAAGDAGSPSGSDAIATPRRRPGRSAARAHGAGEAGAAMVEAAGTAHLRDGDGPASGPTIRIAVLGAIGRHKGAERLAELVRHCHRAAPDLRFVVIGHTDRDTAFERYANVELTGAYAADDVAAAIAAARCTVALFLSIWPETYCFTLSEALSAGLVPVALNIGAIGERVRARGEGHGVLLPLHSPAEAIVAGLRQAAGRKPSRNRGGRAPPIDATYDMLFGDYYAPPDADGIPGTAPVRRPAGAIEATAPDATLHAMHGVFDDLWCTQSCAVTLRITGAVRAVMVRLWSHSDHAAQPLTVRAGGAASEATGWTAPGEVTEVRLGAGAGALRLEDDAVSAFHPDRRTALLRIDMAFAFATPLAPPDMRHGAAKLMSVTVELDDAAAGEDEGEGEGEGEGVVVTLDREALAQAVQSGG